MCSASRATTATPVINELDGPWAVELIRGAEEVIQALGIDTRTYARSLLGRP